MIGYIIKKLFGSKTQRDIKKLTPLIEEINSLEAGMSALGDAELAAKTKELRKRYQEGEGLESLLPEAFAVVREAAKRTLNMRHFDVQIMGGIVLHQGKIIEMKTGEGKTLAATLPIYLNSLTGKGIHVVTVNDYLAQRDSEWMGPIYKFLGLKVGFVQHDMQNILRRHAYACDVTYVTNNEVGFDYLRDNMAISKEDRVLRDIHYAIIDEVDSILIDEARTPLIISGPTESSTDKYYTINKLIPRLNGKFVTEQEEIEAKHKQINITIGFDYVIDEKGHSATLTEEGVSKCERLLGIDNLYDDVQSEWVHHITQALRAYNLFKRDVDYVVKEGQVIIVDEFTGRLMPGRRWSEGLHQAVEAKEGLSIAQENQTLATITFQNYFRLYEKLSGMTGTAVTEAEEFHKIYKLEVVEISTNMPMVREDHADVIYKTEREKNKAIVQEIAENYKKGRPLLVGTRSIEKNEQLGSMLKKEGIPHKVLNAKFHEQEAQIIAQAGRKKAITIATNMAGRGTDIVLGGNPGYIAHEELIKRGYASELVALASEYTPTIDPEVLKAREEYQRVLNDVKAVTDREHQEVIELGGLYVMGTERHESRRIDNQLRGRGGRQGDPGASKFFLALDDDLMRLFGSDRIAPIMERLGMEEGQDIQHPLISRSTESAQKKVEAMNFDVRKQLLEYDNVMNEQRKGIYGYRQKILEGEDLKENIWEMIQDILDERLDMWASKNDYPEKWDIFSLQQWFSHAFGISVSLEMDVIRTWKQEDLREFIEEEIKKKYEQREQELGLDVMRHVERMVMLQVVDNRWKDHLYSLDQLRKGIGLRAYGNKDPRIEYQKEAYNMFMNMTFHIKEEIVEYVFKVRVAGERQESAQLRRPAARPKSPGRPLDPKPAKQEAELNKKIGRNDPCPCGSGKKYKKCCGR
ncbi:MAG: preprotein translocase subunit SecA [bacterium]